MTTPKRMLEEIAEAYCAEGQRGLPQMIHIRAKWSPCQCDRILAALREVAAEWIVACGAYVTKPSDVRHMLADAQERARDAARHEQADRVVALHAKLQGAFALLSPEDAERLGITREMVECEDPACGLYEQHIQTVVEKARQEERKALLLVRSKIDALAWHPSRDSSARAAWHWAVRLIDDILDARSRGEEPKQENP